MTTTTTSRATASQLGSDELVRRATGPFGSHRCGDAPEGPSAFKSRDRSQDTATEVRTVDAGPQWIRTRHRRRRAPDGAPAPSWPRPDSPSRHTGVRFPHCCQRSSARARRAGDLREIHVESSALVDPVRVSKSDTASCAKVSAAAYSPRRASAFARTARQRNCGSMSLGSLRRLDFDALTELFGLRETTLRVDSFGKASEARCEETLLAHALERFTCGTEVTSPLRRDHRPASRCRRIPATCRRN